MFNCTTDILREQVYRWRKKPCLFVKAAFGVDPTDQQAKILNSVAGVGSKTAVKSGHGTGKSCSEAWLGIWHTFNFEDSKTAATAPSASQLKDVLMAEVGKWISKAHPWVKEQLNYSNMRLSVKGAETTQFLTARTARKEDPSALQGLHAKHMMFLIDEAFGVADPIYEVARGALSGLNSRVLLCGNPTHTSGYAYNAFHKNRELWNRITLSCIDSPIVARQYIEEMAKEYGVDSDIYKIRVLGEFPSAAVCQFIPTDLVELARSRDIHHSQYSFAPIVLGVDVSYFGDDRSAIFMRQGLASKLLGFWYNISTTKLADIADQFASDLNADAIFVDVTGVGAGVVDRLRLIGRDPLAVYFGASASKEDYHNKRAECWGEMKKWLQDGGCIPGNEEDLREDLVGPMYGFTARGKIQLERKEDMKRRGLASPDMGDALALTFASPVYKPTAIEKISGQHRTVQTKYDKLNRRR